jgi:hypothetical protein
MGALSSKLRSVQGGHILFWCPGCDGAHMIRVREDGKHEGGAWGYNLDPERPTFTPSVLVRYDGKDAGKEGAPPSVCHSFVTDGRIQFLSDCTHSLAGQTVDLPDFDEDDPCGI